MRLTSALADLAQVYPWLDQATAGDAIPSDLVSRMHVVLEEVVANVAMHGFASGVVGNITLRFSRELAAVRLEVEDDGAAFDPTSAPIRDRPENLLDAVPGGCGLYLIRRFCPSVAYERCGEINRLTMHFPVPG